MQTFGINLLVNYDSLIDNKLTLDGWFLLYCLSTNSDHLLLTYINRCSILDANVLFNMEKEGYIILNNKDNITISSIKITSKGKSLIEKSTLNTQKIFDDCFQELRNTYPTKVPAENGAFRRLHGDLSRCKRLYLKILSNKDIIDIDLHKNILKAINKEINERIKGKNLPFMQNLVTYLHQQNFLQYFDVKEEEIDINKGDDI